MAKSNRILVKMQPGTSLAAAESRADLRPLFRDTGAAAFELAARPAWYVADLADGGPNPWDVAHSQLAGQLGVDESAIAYAEPDILHGIYPIQPSGPAGGQAFAVDSNCTALAQDSGGGREVGPHPGWHLDPEFSQLAAARGAVPFTIPKTRIAHIDTGYDHNHHAMPENLLTDLERSFVDGDNNPTTTQPPLSQHGVLDNVGHGTGTIGILAGRKISALDNIYLGGAPAAEIVSLRIANGVILFWTSAFAQALDYAVSNGCDVVSMSMGGLPSAVWNESVNIAYLAGVCIVSAAGNNFSGAPTRHVVYPARYHRVIAACGVMAKGHPYDGLDVGVMEGNYGPDSCMTAALSAYTPNIPWPVFTCADTVRMNGEGTSSATPQIAAAAALWFEKYKDSLPRDWHRVEAVRNALFSSADRGDPRLGHGMLRAQKALAVAPDLNLPMTPADSDSFAFLRVLTGLGVTDAPPREKMFNLELSQLWLLNKDLSEIVPDPDAAVDLPDATMKKFAEAVIEDSRASLTLRRHLADRHSIVFGVPARNVPLDVVPAVRPACKENPQIDTPAFRRLRAYAVDPSLSTRLDTADVNEVTLSVKWEELEPGPTGEYLEVRDVDAAGTSYPPVDLNDPRLLAQDGLPPAEGNAAFHQQMVYAVSMKTIEYFEHALGRPVLWRPKFNSADDFDDSQFVRRLGVRPHALHEANAYYSPQQEALLFGYFEAAADDPGEHVPGSAVYTCLSHDIVAHETTHAILDGMHRRFNEPSNPDVLAMHEGFADIVALLQHFTLPEILKQQMSRVRGDLEAESILGSLALQFGRALGKRGALRDAIGTLDDKDVWKRLPPDPADYQRLLTPHARGAILVAAVFDAFLAIYKRRTADLLRIYTGGTGVLPSGAVHPDLVNRLADEASKSARHVLDMCIRTLDYVPPVDITFGEFLRGLITADFDLVGDDPLDYRVAFVEAFRRRGIYPPDLDTLSVDTLRWRGPDFEAPPKSYRPILDQLKRYAGACFYIADRGTLFRKTRQHRAALKVKLAKAFRATPKFAADFGLDPELGPESFEVHELRRSIRVSPDGHYVPQVIVGLTQSKRLTIEGVPGDHVFRGGSTLIVDLSKPAISYVIRKNLTSAARRAKTEAFLKQALSDPLRALLFANRHEPFAALHALSELDS